MKPVCPPGEKWSLPSPPQWVQQAHVIGSPATSLMWANLAGTGLLPSTDHPHPPDFLPATSHQSPHPTIEAWNSPPHPPPTRSQLSLQVTVTPYVCPGSLHPRPPCDSPLGVLTPEAEFSEGHRTKVRLGQPGKGLRENGTGSSLPQSHPGDEGGFLELTPNLPVWERGGEKAGRGQRNKDKEANPHFHPGLHKNLTTPPSRNCDPLNQDWYCAPWGSVSLYFFWGDKSCHFKMPAVCGALC